MKTIRKHIECSVLLLTSIVLFQSCVVYQKTNVSLEQASKQDLKAKINTKSNETFLVHKIIYEDDNFYGLQRVNGKKIRITLHVDDIKSIWLVETSPNLMHQPQELLELLF